MFNREYKFSNDQIADMLQFLYGDGVVCEAPLDIDRVLELGNYWELLTSHITDSFKGNIEIHIHNSTIYYFRQILTIIIFIWENTNKINPKELFFICSIFEPTLVNSAPFMIAHMQALGTDKKGPTSIGGLITSIARALGLDTELVTLEPLPPCFLDLPACRHIRLIRSRSDGKYLVMVHNTAVISVILSCSNAHMFKIGEIGFKILLPPRLASLNLWIFLNRLMKEVKQMMNLIREIEALQYMSHHRTIPPHIPDSPGHTTPHFLTILQVLLSEPRALHLMTYLVRCAPKIP